jgi:hypothetical protein
MMRAARAASRGRSISTSTPMNEMYMVQASMMKFSIATIADCFDFRANNPFAIQSRAPLCSVPVFLVPAFQAAICRAKGARQDSPGQRPGNNVPKTNSSPERASQNQSHT